MIVDTHAHLNFKAFKSDSDEVIKRCKKDDILVLNVGSKYETSKGAVELAEKHEGMFAAIGLHPMHVKTGLLKMKSDSEEGGFEMGGEDFDEEKYIELAKSKKVKAVGEIGLDYYYRPKSKAKQQLFKEKQKEIFLKQFNMARKLGLPVILHCRMAHQDLLEILKPYIVNREPKIIGVVHCFTGTREQAEEYIKMGFLIGLNGIIFKMDLDEVIKTVPLEKIVLETDCPYLTPPEAGVERNEPIFVKYVVQKISELKGVSFEEAAEVTTRNARKLFGI